MGDQDAKIGTTSLVIGLAYFLVAAASVALTRFDGGVACLWFAGALQMAALIHQPPRAWPAIFVSCALASVAATTMLGVGPGAAVPLAAVNLLEALIGVLLIDRFGLRRDSLDSVGRLVAMVTAVGVVAPAATAPLGAGLVTWTTGTGFGANLLNWLSGHALGAMTAVPVFSVIASGEFGRWFRRTSRAKMVEAGTLLLLVAATSAAVFAQEARPVLFLPILPVILATFRIGRFGAVASVLIVAGVGGWLTARGQGPLNLLAGDAVTRAHFLQFYLACTVLTAFPVAAELRHRAQLFNRLRESEARFRLLAENSSDIVMSLQPDGTVRYVSPAIRQMGGFDPDRVVGARAVDMVLPEYRGELIRAHAAALAEPDRTVTVDYRALTATGELRWFESNMRGVRDEAGRVTGTVSVVRDISRRKEREGELSRAATTDPLTGLANRRAFDAALDRVLGGGRPACLAVVDIDHFKRVNDQWGHAAGDRVLVAFAELARGALRDGDMVARLGGEEFGVLLPGADLSQARAVCERLRRTVASAVLEADGRAVRVTASVGLAAVAAGATRAEAMRGADDALYRAKAEGRDRLRLAA